METDKDPFEHRQDKQETHIHKDHEIEVPVTEEQLIAEKREVERGAVRVRKTVVEEERTIDVPVTEEEIEITRRPVDREIDPDRHEFGGDVSVPVKGEEVDVEKQTRVVEEIDIERTPVTKTREVSDTVRREEVEIGGENIDLREHGNEPGEDEGV